MPLLRKKKDSYHVRLNKSFYDVDHIISVLTSFDVKNTLDIGFSNIGNDRYIKINIYSNKMEIKEIINTFIH
jgi:hypothetical protein